MLRRTKHREKGQLVLLLSEQDCACSAGAFLLAGLWGAKVILRDAAPPRIMVHFNGREKGEYVVPANPLPLAVVVPLWESLGDIVISVGLQDQDAEERLNIFRRADLLTRYRR